MGGTQNILTVSVDKNKMWNLADAVLRNGDVFYICNRIIDAEFEELN